MVERIEGIRSPLVQRPYQSVNAVDVFAHQFPGGVVPWGLHRIELPKKRAGIVEGFILKWRRLTSAPKGVSGLGDIDGIQMPRESHPFEEVVERSVGIKYGLRNRHRP